MRQTTLFLLFTILILLIVVFFILYIYYFYYFNNSVDTNPDVIYASNDDNDDNIKKSSDILEIKKPIMIPPLQCESELNKIKKYYNTWSKTDYAKIENEWDDLSEVNMIDPQLSKQSTNRCDITYKNDVEPLDDTFKQFFILKFANSKYNVIGKGPVIKL